MFAVALICIVVTPLPYWIAAIACGVVLVANVLAIVKAKVAVDTVVGVDEKIEKATAFICDMREESESLLAIAKSDEVKAICKKICDAFKYSDPMSNEALTIVEKEIQTHFDLLKKGVTEGKAEVVASELEKIFALLAERNNKCKRLK